MSLSIVGIHTGIGKTLCSAFICQAMGFDYWKPVQAGDLENSDSMFIKNYVNNPACSVHPERYQLQAYASPHHASALENKEIKKEDFILPETKNKLVVETAGGLMSPLSNHVLNIDLVEHLKLPVILVSKHYLGSINHTLMTFSALKARRIPMLGLVFMGECVPPSEKIILEYTTLPHLFSIPWFAELRPSILQEYARQHPIKLPV